MLADTAVVLDFETTGLDCSEGHRVTEVAALRIRGGQIAERFASLVNCGRRVPPHIVAFTGITQAMVDSAPQPRQAFTQLLAFIGADPIIAHNAWFDRSFLSSECRQLGLEPPASEFLCSHEIARRALPELHSHALGSLANRLRLPFSPGLHRAAVDADIVAHVMLKICERLQIGGIRELRALTAQQTEALASAA